MSPPTGDTVTVDVDSTVEVMTLSGAVYDPLGLDMEALTLGAVPEDLMLPGVFQQGMLMITVTLYELAFYIIAENCNLLYQCKPPKYKTSIVKCVSLYYHRSWVI